MEPTTCVATKVATKVALYASDPITAAGIAVHLRERPEFQLLPEPQYADAEVLVVAIDQMTRDAMGVIRTAGGHSPAPRIVLVVDKLRQDEFNVLAACGVVRLLPRRHLAGRELVAAISSADRSDSCSTEALRSQVDRLGPDLLRPKGLGEPVLTPRETDVIRLLAEGHDTAAIATKLCYSERTVKAIVQAILTRLQLRNRVHAVAYAMRVGII